MSQGVFLFSELRWKKSYKEKVPLSEIFAKIELDKQNWGFHKMVEYLDFTHSGGMEIRSRRPKLGTAHSFILAKIPVKKKLSDFHLAALWKLERVPRHTGTDVVELYGFCPDVIDWVLAEAAVGRTD